MSAGGDAVIQWYPGHMAQAMRKVGALLRVLDIVIEVVDARLPQTSANPALAAMARRKTHLRVLSHADLAEPAVTRRWLGSFARAGLPAIAVEANTAHGARQVAAKLAEIAPDRPALRAVVVGTPNTGKSALINGLLGRTAAKVANKAGVTRAPQWFRVGGKLEVLDTPGLMVPKIATPEAQWMLALIGALPAPRFDPEDVVARFEAWRGSHAPGSAVPPFDRFVAERGFLRQGGEADRHNAALAYLRAFNAGTFGRLSLEVPAATEEAAG